MKKQKYALILAVLSCSTPLGCTPHDTNSASSNPTSEGAGAGGVGGASDRDDANEAGAAGTRLTVGGASATEPSVVGDVEQSTATGGANSAASGGANGNSLPLAEAGDANTDGAADNAGAGGAAGSAGSTTDSDSSTATGGTAGASSTAASALAGYTLYAYADTTNTNSHSELVDMNGNLVHTWDIGGIPVKMLPGGDLIGAMGLYPGDYDLVRMSQVSWTGEEHWAYQNFAPAGDGTFAARQHHDFQREGNPVGYWAPGQDFVDNGSTLVLAHEFRSAPEIRDDGLDDDVVYEVDATGTLKGSVWRAADHVSEFGFDEAALADIRTRNPGTTLEWLHCNSASLVGPNHWFDEGHTEFAPNNIILSSRNANFVAIIDRETGKIVWRVGPDFAGRPEEKLGQFSGQHNPHLIPKGLPGAGNMIVFDNGGVSGFGGPNNTDRYSRGWSRVLEFNPVTFDAVWQYGSASGSENFYSAFVSNEQRLPNGNTVITIGLPGRVIEVAPSKEVVWQYTYTATGSGRGSSSLYRSYRIAPDWLPEGVNAAHGNYPLWRDLFPTQ